MPLNLLLLAISTAAEEGTPRLVRVMRDQDYFKRVMRHQQPGTDHFNRIVRDPGHFNRLMKDQYDIVKDLSDKRDHGRASDLFHRIMRDQEYFNRVMRDEDHFNRVMRDQDNFMMDQELFNRVMRSPRTFDRVMKSSDTFDRVMRDSDEFSQGEQRDQGVWQLQDPHSFVSDRDHRYADYTRIMKRRKYSHENTPDLSERPLGRLSTGTQKDASFFRYLREESPKVHYSLVRLM